MEIQGLREVTSNANVPPSTLICVEPAAAVQSMRAGETWRSPESQLISVATGRPPARRTAPAAAIIHFAERFLTGSSGSGAASHGVTGATCAICDTANIPRAVLTGPLGMVWGDRKSTRLNS